MTEGPTTLPASRRRRRLTVILTISVAIIVMVAGIVVIFQLFEESPFPSDNISVKLTDGKVVYTQLGGVGRYPYTGMKIIFRVEVGSASMTMPSADFGNQSLLGAGLPAVTHQILMTSSWTNASINITDSTGDGIFNDGDTIEFDLIPLPEDMVFTVGWIWTLGDGGGAIKEFSFAAHHGKLYAWYSQVLGDWYDEYLSYMKNRVLPNAVDYLSGLYNETLSLVRVGNDTEDLKNTYFIYSDNYLVSLVLQSYDPANGTLISRAHAITSATKNFTTGIEPINQYTVLTDSHSVDMSVFNNSKDFNLTTVEGAKIRTTQNNQTGPLDPTRYADIAFLQAIYFHELGMENESVATYQHGVDMFDGKGFKDNAFDGTYQTYKLALYVYAIKLLYNSSSLGGPDYEVNAFSTLVLMQQPNGGFATGYDSSLRVTTYSNSETTSLAILALDR